MYRKFFTKITIPKKLIDIFIFCEKELIVYAFRFQLTANYTFAITSSLIHLKPCLKEIMLKVIISINHKIELNLIIKVN